MAPDSTLRSLFQLFPNLQARIQEAQALLPEAVLESYSDITEDDCKAVLRYETNLTCTEAEALRIARGLPELYEDPLVVDIGHQPTLVFAHTPTGGIYIELTTSLARTRRHLAECGSFHVSFPAMIPGDEALKQSWHKRFENQNIHGSWFRASSKLMKALSELAPKEG